MRRLVVGFSKVGWGCVVVWLGRFSMYDYGFWNNVKKYLFLFLLEYDVFVILVIFFIFLVYGGNDVFVDFNDVVVLISKLVGFF